MVDVTYDVILGVLRQNGGNVTAAAKQLGYPRSTLWDRLQRKGYFTSVHKAASKSPRPLDSDDEIRAAREADTQERKLARQLRDERKKRKQAEEDLDRMEEALRVYADTTMSAGETTHYSVKVTDRPPKRSKEHLSPATVVLSLADWHVGANVSVAEVNGLNEYNSEIAWYRTRRLWDKVVQMIAHTRHIADVNRVVMWLGGDLISGTLHDLPEVNDVGVVDAIKSVQGMLTEGIETVLDLDGINQVHVITSRGNHGRSTPDRRIASADQNSWEQVIYDNLASHYADRDRLTFQSSPSPFSYMTINGFRCRFTHGDLIRYSGGVLGVGVPILKAINKWDVNDPVDMTFLGHYHQSTWARRYIMTGSLIGLDQYALSIGAAKERPSQQFTVLDSKYGVTQSFPLFVEP